MLKSLCVWLHLCTTLTGPAYVIDGDTIVVEGIHVRVWGIDAEEWYELNGPAAKDAMIMLTGDAEIICKLNGKRSYQRYVGTCFNEGRDLAEEIVDLGYALDCAHYSGGKYRQFEPQNIRFRLKQKPYC